MELLKTKWIIFLKLKVTGVLFKLYTTHLQETKIQRRAQKNSLIILDISTQLIKSHLWMLDHSLNSKTPLNSLITRKPCQELLSQLSSDKKELIKHQLQREQYQSILPRKLICLKDIQWLSLDNSITVSSMPILSLRRWKSQTLFNLQNFTQLDQCQRTTQHGTVMSHHSNTMPMLFKNE